MFTGIIETIGAVEKNRGGRLEIEVGNEFGKDIKQGTSVAVNGACLTNVKCQPRKLSGSNVKCLLCFDVVPETFSRTNLGLLQKGDKVNLERALKADGRFEGHILEGHVDEKSNVKCQMSKLKKDCTKDIVIAIEIPKNLKKYIVPKGSVAVDGISLTVVDVLKNYFTVAVIPHTMENTIAKFYKKGSLVNIEVDIVGKYVQNLLNPYIKK